MQMYAPRSESGSHGNCMASCADTHCTMVDNHLRQRNNCEDDRDRTPVSGKRSIEYKRINLSVPYIYRNNELPLEMTSQL